MRELGVMQASFGLLTVTLGPPPIDPVVLKQERDDPHHARRAHYSTMLGYRPTDKELEDLP